MVNVRNSKVYNSLKSLLLMSVGVSFTACMADPKPQSQWDRFGSNAAATYTPLYIPAEASKVPERSIHQDARLPGNYVQYAQYHAGPHTKYVRAAPQTPARHPYYRDYPAQTSEYYARPHATGPQANGQTSPGQTYGQSGQTTTTYRVVGEDQAQYRTNQDSDVSSIRQTLGGALTQSPRLAIEELRIREAEEGLIQANAQSKFKLNLNSVVGASQSETVFNIVDRTDDDFRVRRAANLDLSLPLYSGGRINAQKNVAKVGIKSAIANYDAVESVVTQEAAVAHLNVIRDRKLIKIYDRNVTLLEKQKTNVRAMVNAGENTLTDEALIDARLASIQVRLEQVRADLASSESNYKKLVGRSAPALMPAGTIDLPSSLSEIKVAARENNPQVKNVQTQAEAAFHNVEIAKSFGRPTLALQGVLRAAEGQSETIRRDSAAELLLNFSVPLLSGGENKSRVRQAALAQSRALLETRELQNNLDERLEQLWASVRSAKRSKAPNLAQKAAARKAYDAIVKQRHAGVATSLDVLSVEQTLLDAEINLVQSQNVEDVARFQLLGLMGAL